MYRKRHRQAIEAHLTRLFDLQPSHPGPNFLRSQPKAQGGIQSTMAGAGFVRRSQVHEHGRRPGGPWW